MKESCKAEFIDLLPHIDQALCLGYGFEVSDLKVGQKFIISPNFEYQMSNDNWNVADAIKQCEFKDWQIGGALCFYTDEFEILQIVPKRTKKQSIAKLRVRNLRTDVDFNLLTDQIELDNLATLDLYILQ
jgi:hypothetical protein